MVRLNRFNHTSLMSVVTPTDRPQSVPNCRVIEVFGGCQLVVCLYKGFRHRTDSDHVFLFCSQVLHMVIQIQIQKLYIVVNLCKTNKFRRACILQQLLYHVT